MAANQNSDVKTSVKEALENVSKNDNPANYLGIPLNAFNLSIGGDPSKADHNNVPYGKAKVVKQDEGVKGHEAARKKFAPKADEKTTAGAPKGTKDINSAMNITGAQAAQILKGLISAAAVVSALMASNSSSAAQEKTVSNALTDALKYLCNKHGFQYVMKVFDKCFENNGFKLLDDKNQSMVKEAFAALIKEVSDNGSEKNLPVTSTPPIIIYESVNKPVPLPVYGVPPDLYVQQYYAVGSDPWPGFIQWKGPNGDYVYTVRTLNDPPYESPTQHVYGATQTLLSKSLEPYVINNNLTPDILNTLLNSSIQTVQDTGMNAALGAGAAQKLMSLLPMLLGALSTPINLTLLSHLPTSVLDQGAVKKSMEKYSKNMALIKKMKSDLSGAFSLPTALGGLASLGSLGDIASNLSTAVTGGLTLGSLNALSAAGLSAISVNSLNSIASLSNLSPESIGMIASSSSILQNVGVGIEAVNVTQNLLSKVL
jgi:hypothetical protein